MDNISVAAFKINIDENNIELIDPEKIKDEIQEYLQNLLKDIYKKPASKKYTRRRDTTEFSNFLIGLKDVAEENPLTHESAVNIAQRLLDEEIKSDKEMRARLKKDGHVKRGSFLQFLFTEDDTRYYLGVKLEHAVFISSVRKENCMSFCQSLSVFSFPFPIFW